MIGFSVTMYDGLWFCALTLWVSCHADGPGTPRRERQRSDETIGRARRSESVAVVSIVVNIPTTALVASKIETASEPGLERGEEFLESVRVERHRE